MNLKLRSIKQAITIILFLAMYMKSLNISGQTILSPDKLLELHFELVSGKPSYQLSFKNKTVLKPSFLGFHLKDQQALTDQFELIDFHQEADLITVQLRHEDDSIENLTCNWLIGCDGAKSTIRKKLGFQFQGDTFEQILAQADVQVTFPFETNPNEAYMSSEIQALADLFRSLERDATEPS